MLHSARTILLICNAIVIPASLFLGAVLVYGVKPVDFEWVVQSQADDGAAIQGEFTPACAPRFLTTGLYSHEALAKFAAEAVVDLNTFDYLNWDETLTAAATRYMTERSGLAFMDSFRRGSLLAGVREDYLSVASRLVSGPIVTTISKIGVAQKWTVQVPVAVFFGTGARTVAGVQVKDSMTQTFVFTVDLVEEPPRENNFRGIAVLSMKATRIQNVSILESLRNEVNRP